MKHQEGYIKMNNDLDLRHFFYEKHPLNLSFYTNTQMVFL